MVGVFRNDKCEYITACIPFANILPFFDNIISGGRELVDVNSKIKKISTTTPIADPQLKVIKLKAQWRIVRGFCELFLLPGLIFYKIIFPKKGIEVDANYLKPVLPQVLIDTENNLFSTHFPSPSPEQYKNLDEDALKLDAQECEIKNYEGFSDESWIKNGIPNYKQMTINPTSKNSIGWCVREAIEKPGYYRLVYGINDRSVESALLFTAVQIANSEWYYLNLPSGVHRLNTPYGGERISNLLGSQFFWTLDKNHQKVYLVINELGHLQPTTKEEIMAASKALGLIQ